MKTVKHTMALEYLYEIGVILDQTDSTNAVDLSHIVRHFALHYHQFTDCWRIQAKNIIVRLTDKILLVDTSVTRLSKFYVTIIRNILYKFL